MKIHITLFLAAFALCSSSMLAQSSLNNYIKESTLLDVDGNHVTTSINYYDGFGRAIQSATNENCVSGAYLVSGKRLDSKGRCISELLPVVSSSLELVGVQTLQSEAQSQYHDNYPFIQKEYSATNELVSEIRQGSLWHTNSKKQVMENVPNGSQEVKLYTAPLNGNSLVHAGFYAPRTLVAQRTTDEDGKTMTVFWDLQGKKILERRGENNDTYFVYNDRDELRFVLSPQYQDDNDVRKFAYEYQYDAKGRVERTYLPGCSYQQFWYDCMDRPVFFQDSRLRGRNLYRYYLYDNFSRVTEQGVCSDLNRSSATVEIHNYYDNYDFLDSMGGLADSISISRAHHAYPASLLTGVRMTASDGTVFHTALYYDGKGNLTDRKTCSEDGRTLGIHNTYSYTDKVVSSAVTLDGNASFALQNTYDANTDLLLAQNLTSSVCGVTSSNDISQYTYDNYGRVALQATGSVTDPIAFEYDMHGWLKAISNPAFSENIKYASTGTGTPCFNGNISSMSWKASDDQWMTYDFEYDNLNRLVSSSYSSNGAHLRYNESVGAYSKNGSVLQFTRRGRKTDTGRFIVVDDLSMTYDGNRLIKVDDSAQLVTTTGTFDFSDGSDESVEYLYDGCGALIADKNKGIANIAYDNLGYPKEIQFSNGNKTRYVYLPDGTKLKTTHITAVDGIVVPLSNTVELADYQIINRDSTEYFGDIIYENGIVRRYIYDGGYVSVAYYSPSDVSYLSYHHYVKDHLGNIRAVVSDNGIVEQTTHYYPSGAIMSDISTNQSLQPNKYNGKELDRMHGLDWYDYGARNYDAQILTWDRMDPLCENYYNISPYVYCMNNPVKFIDPDGRKGFLVHGTWSSGGTWHDIPGLKEASKTLFNDGDTMSKFDWSGNNNCEARTAAAGELIDQLVKEINDGGITNNEPITLIGHSHGGNVIIEAINKMVGMKEFDGIQINLLTINTPVRNDYQLSKTAQKRVNHVNVYDPKDPVQIRGGQNILKDAGRTFSNAQNIEVDNPQGAVEMKWSQGYDANSHSFATYPTLINGDFHNSHNRVNTWIHKIKN